MLYLKRSKCFFSKRCVAYLGHVISAAGITMDEQKVQLVLSWSVPASVRAVLAFLGMAGYYQCFICDFGSIVAPSPSFSTRRGSSGHRKSTPHSASCNKCSRWSMFSACRRSTKNSSSNATCQGLASVPFCKGEGAITFFSR
jgi:hypothetical protein